MPESRKNRVLTWPPSKKTSLEPPKIGRAQTCYPYTYESSGLCHFLGMVSPWLSHLRWWAISWLRYVFWILASFEKLRVARRMRQPVSTMGRSKKCQSVQTLLWNSYYKLPISRFPNSNKANKIRRGSLFGVLFDVVCLYAMVRDVCVSIFCCRDGWNVTKTKMPPKLKCHPNWNATKTEMSPKLECHQN